MIPLFEEAQKIKIKIYLEHDKNFDLYEVCFIRECGQYFYSLDEIILKMFSKIM